MTGKRPSAVRVALINDSTVVLEGLTAMLAGFHEQVEVAASGTTWLPVPPVDVVLLDSFGYPGDLFDFVDTIDVPVVVFASVSDPAAVRAALHAGATGYVARAVPTRRLVAALRRASAGQVAVETAPHGMYDAGADGDEWDWPGRSAGLTARESEALALSCRGLNDLAVARALYLSPYVVTSLMRTARLTLDLSTRAQSLHWGLEHWFTPTPSVRPECAADVG